MPDDSETPTPESSLSLEPAPPSEDEQEVDEEESSIPQLLSSLSREGGLPSGVDGPEPTLFEPEEVSLLDNDWLRRVIDVQGWLGLDAPLSADAAILDTAKSLFAQLAPNSDAEQHFVSGDVLTLTDSGEQVLETRLSNAQQNRLDYDSAIEDGRSRADASEDWRTYWEELGSQSRSFIKQIIAKVETVRIKHIKEWAELGKLDLNPSYQRDIVWSNSESRQLIDSVLRGIPLPSIILTKDSDSKKFQIVDGKQRLTAILRFIGHHPDGRKFAKTKIDGLTELDKKPRKFIKKHGLRPADLGDLFLPFKLSTYKESADPLHKLSGKYYAEILDQVITVGTEQTTVRGLFEEVDAEYWIPVITYRETSIQDIHQVFSLYNKQGKKLNAEELRNAVFHHLAFTRLMLALSGDRVQQKTELAPFLPADLLASIEDIGEALKARGFGTSRFKRTKVLNWTTAVVLHPPGTPNQPLTTPSTAGHINSMLKAIGDPAAKKLHKLRQEAVLTTLAKDIQSSVMTHQEAKEAWSPQFLAKKKTPSKWEELPLVASLVGSMLVVIAGKRERLLEQIPKIRAFSETREPPRKVQNKDQWQHIARVATGILDQLEVADAELGPILEDRYGYNCLPNLRKLASLGP